MKAKVLIFLLGLGFSFSVMASNPATNFVPQNNGPKYGNDSVTCIMNLSLYREFYKQWRQSHYTNSSINDAIDPWYWTFKNCPRATENIYIDGARMMKFRIHHAPPAARKAMIDTLMMIYTQRLRYFPDKYRTNIPQKGEILGREAIALYQVDPAAVQKVYELMKQSIDLNKERSMGAVMVYYFRLTTQLARAGKIDTTAVVDVYNQIQGYVNNRIQKYKTENNTRKLTEYQDIKANINATFQPFATCTDLVHIYTKEFAVSPNNEILLKDIIRSLESKQCYNNTLYFKANINLYKMDPSPDIAFLLGKLMFQRNKYNDAIFYLTKATQLTNPGKLVEADMLMAQAYQVLNNYPKAREMAYQALKVNPHYGLAYALIGDLYSESASKCGNTSLTKKVAYWAAVDKYIQAKRADPKLTKSMNERIAIYRQHFPTTEMLFFYNMKKGEKYRVPCWINEETTVRAASK